MKRLSQTLTMALLLVTTLNAAASELTNGNITPPTAANNWIAEKAAGRTPTESADQIHQALKAEADAALAAKDLDLLVKLYRRQQSSTEDSNHKPINDWMILDLLREEASEAEKKNNPERLLELYLFQKKFMQKFKIHPSYRAIYPDDVHKAFSALLFRGVPNDPERFIYLRELWKDFTRKHPVPDDFSHDPKYFEAEANSLSRLLKKTGGSDQVKNPGTSSGMTPAGKIAIPAALNRIFWLMTLSGAILTMLYSSL